MMQVLLLTLLSVLAALGPPSAWAVGTAGAAVGLMAETLRKMEIKKKKQQSVKASTFSRAAKKICCAKSRTMISCAS